MMLVAQVARQVAEGGDAFWPSLATAALVAIIGTIVVLRRRADILDARDEREEEHYRRLRLAETVPYRDAGHVEPLSADPRIEPWDWAIECPELAYTDAEVAANPDPSTQRFHRNRDSLAASRKRRQLVKDEQAAAFYQGKEAAARLARDDASRTRVRRGK